MNKIIILILFVLLSCKSNQFTKGENIFIVNLIEIYPKIKNGNYLVFILNKSDCSPCETEIEQLCVKKRPGLKKIYIVSNVKKNYTFEKENYIYYNDFKLLKFGLKRINGSVLFFKNGICENIESIDIPNIKKLDFKIDSFYR
jgi:hypothetical protein